MLFTLIYTSNNFNIKIGRSKKDTLKAHKEDTDKDTDKAH